MQRKAAFYHTDHRDAGHNLRYAIIPTVPKSAKCKSFRLEKDLEAGRERPDATSPPSPNTPIAVLSHPGRISSAVQCVL